MDDKGVSHGILRSKNWILHKSDQKTMRAANMMAAQDWDPSVTLLQGGYCPSKTRTRPGDSYAIGIGGFSIWHEVMALDWFTQSFCGSCECLCCPLAIVRGARNMKRKRRLGSNTLLDRKRYNIESRKAMQTMTACAKTGWREQGSRSANPGATRLLETIFRGFNPTH